MLKQVTSILNELLKGDINYSSFEKRYLTKNKKVIWAYISTSIVRDTNNKPQFFISQIVDITEKKQADESIRKLSLAVEQSPAIIMITDTAGHIEYVNTKFTSTTGYTFEEIIGANPRILKSGHSSVEQYSELWRTISSGNEWRGEFLNKKKNGEFYWEYAFISPILNEDGITTNYLAVKEDISERKKLLTDLIEAKQKAEEMNKIKSYFFANMSHELRTPFVGIMGFSELLSESLQNPEEREMAQQILKSSKRLTETLNKILNVTRIEFDNLEIKNKNFDVCKLIKDISVLYSSSAQLKNTTISANCDNESIMIYSDPKVLEDVLNNLVSNAIKFTENGFIYLKVKKIREGDIEFLVLSVEDTGIGIPVDKQEIVWQEFRQVSEGLNRSFEGTGLGLTISRKYVKQLGGEISLQSEDGKGTTFTIKIPFKEALTEVVTIKDEAIELSKPVKEKRISLRTKVLYVEDDAIALQYINIVLKSLCEVDTAMDASSAIKSTEKKKYDLLMLDINLGRGMDGIELMQRIRQNPDYKNIPIVAVTAYASENDKKEFLEKGFSHYLSKPFTSNELKKLLNELFV